jgi:hypothetical protein
MKFKIVKDMPPEASHVGTTPSKCVADAFKEASKLSPGSNTYNEYLKIEGLSKHELNSIYSSCNQYGYLGHAGFRASKRSGVLYLYRSDDFVEKAKL